MCVAQWVHCNSAKSRSVRTPAHTFLRPHPALQRPVPVVRLTAKERILIHLADYAKYADVVEVTPEMGQEGIAAAAGIYVQHVRQFLDPLLKEGLVRERTAHVKGHRRRLKVYDLTDSGRLSASRLREQVRGEPIRVRDATGVSSRPPHPREPWRASRKRPAWMRSWAVGRSSRPSRGRTQGLASSSSAASPESGSRVSLRRRARNSKGRTTCIGTRSVPGTRVRPCSQASAISSRRPAGPGCVRSSREGRRRGPTRSCGTTSAGRAASSSSTTLKRRSRRSSTSCVS